MEKAATGLKPFAAFVCVNLGTPLLHSRTTHWRLATDVTVREHGTPIRRASGEQELTFVGLPLLVQLQ